MVIGSRCGLQFQKLQKVVLSYFDAVVERLVVQLDVANVSGPICSALVYVHVI